MAAKRIIYLRTTVSGARAHCTWFATTTTVFKYTTVKRIRNVNPTENGTLYAVRSRARDLCPAGFCERLGPLSRGAAVAVRRPGRGDERTRRFLPKRRRPRDPFAAPRRPNSRRYVFGRVRKKSEITRVGSTRSSDRKKKLKVGYVSTEKKHTLHHGYDSSPGRDYGGVPTYVVRYMRYD